MTASGKGAGHPWPVRLYFLLRNGLRKGLGLIEIAFEGFWLGISSGRLHHDIDRYCYDSWPLYRDETYNRGGLMAWEARAIDQYFRERQRLLLAAAGGGREALALTSMGFQVLAFECHDGLREAANRLLAGEDPPTRVIACQRDHCPDLAGTFDGLIIGWGAYMLIQGSERRISFLRQLRARVTTGAPLLLSFFFRNAGSKHFRLIFRVANIIGKISGRGRLELGDRLGPNFVHYFSREELEKELLAADFRMELFETLEYGHAVAVATDPPPSRPPLEQIVA